MSSNPLFPQDDSQPSKPIDPAVELIRSKVSRVYAEEPDAVQELAEVQERRLLSKHQSFMQELSGSGKSLAEIQTEWHRYYTTLSDPEKHEVWQEFYAANQNTPYQKLFQKQQETAAHQPKVIQPPEVAQPVVLADTLQDDTDEPKTYPKITAVSHPLSSPGGIVVGNHEPLELKPLHKQLADKETVHKLKSKVANRVSAGGKLTAKHHLQSVAFGLVCGFVVLILFLFTFFNQYIIAPFIQPSRTVSSTPIILSDMKVAADTPPSVMVPKINIQIPLDFTLNTYNESVIENSLKHGAIHYANTSLPGQNGNGAYFGHSSGNIFNSGKYFFSFTSLHLLTTGDLFYITYGGQTYAYRVFDKTIVPPSDVGIINDTHGKQATAELITCDPPGISTNRLVVWGEQISPNPATNGAPSKQDNIQTPQQLNGNGPTLWSQFVNKLEFWN
ncbi:MAG TPA: sortase [Candidatus Saccharimonadales bacterium]|nr:sortase [Candidatus Saccharimonadales bacterium]